MDVLLSAFAGAAAEFEKYETTLLYVVPFFVVLGALYIWRSSGESLNTCEDGEEAVPRVDSAPRTTV